MEKHFVTFYSPGTFVSEQTSKPIEAWDIAMAARMARDIDERHGATPYGFAFTTRYRGPDDFDSKEVARSGMFYLGGTVRTYEQVVADNLPDEQILRDNMRYNNMKAVITNNNSWRFTGPFNDGDVVIDFTPAPKKGN